MKKFLTFLGWPILLIPTLLLYLGAGMNEAAIWANGGQMPVKMYACQERMNAPAKPDADELLRKMFGGAPKAQQSKDYVHKCADANTHLRVFEDWIVSDNGVSSIGDMVQDTAEGLQPLAFYVWLGVAAIWVWKRIRPERWYN
jgi:hypothetical protein